MDPLIILSIAITLAYYSYLGYEDWRKREIESKAFYLMIPFIAVLNALYFLQYGLPIIVNLAVGLLSFVLIFVMSLFGMMGKGDAFIVSYMFLLNPFPISFMRIPIFPGFIATILSFVFPLLIIFRNVYVNLKRIKEFESLTKGLGKGTKAYYFLFGETLKKDEFRRKKFYFPLLASGMKRLHANMEVEPLSPEGYKIDGEYVIASFGVPLATAELVGYIIFLALFPLGIASPLL
ncbi:MAG: hypothetical protein JHC28_05400 [Thermoprotei archaeon]|nr:hypothetical protein [Thermoprotei archaeon]